MTDRRYTEDEVAEIFRRATDTAQQASPQLPGSGGMTLTQLQEIGREVGIAPDAVANAAGALSPSGRPALQRFLGLPVAVGRTVEIGRRITDAEWEHLVVDLRETFDARGTVRSDGTFRQWTNGNLQALLEPTHTGHQLRLRTTNANARALMIGGLGMFALATAGVVSVMAQLGLAGAATRVSPLIVIGSVLFGVGALRLPQWARDRARQMAEVASRFAALK